jgi:hypothetical protein
MLYARSEETSTGCETSKKPTHADEEAKTINYLYTNKTTRHVTKRKQFKTSGGTKI